MLSPDYLADIDQRPLEELRAMRAECVGSETGLSYLRRMVQGPLDIVLHELARRSGGADRADLATLVAELPDTLSEQPRPGGVGRLPQTLEPGDLDAELVAELGAMVGAGRVAEIPEMSDGDLTALADALKAFEDKVSELRRGYFATIDAIQAEMARRYKTGEASVETLLNP